MVGAAVKKAKEESVLGAKTEIAQKNRHKYENGCRAHASSAGPCRVIPKRGLPSSKQQEPS